MLPKLLTSIFGSRNDRLIKQFRAVVQPTEDPTRAIVDIVCIPLTKVTFNKYANRELAMEEGGYPAILVMNSGKKPLYTRISVTHTCLF